MIKTVLKHEISKIFPVDGEKTYKIPRYQREYTWKQKEWEALFNDVIENDSGYFLGSFICVSDSTMTNSSELIDGQQRFTSISLLLLAIYKMLIPFKDEMNDEEQKDLLNLKSQLTNKQTYKDATGKKTYTFSSRLELQVQNWNHDDYLYILYDVGIINHASKQPYISIRRLYRAYKYFTEALETYINEVIEQNPDNNRKDLLFSIVDKFNSAVMVGIEVDTHKDAYMLFESLNHRGVPLSALDLIKNMLIAASESDNKSDECYNQWCDVLRFVGDDYRVQERFFRQYYNSFRLELNKPFMNSDDTKMYPLGYLATRTTLLEIYERLVKSNYNTFIDDLLNKSKIYSVLVNNSDDVNVYSDALKDLERIGGTPSYLLLLYIMAHQSRLNLSNDEVKNIIQFLICFFVRRNVTDLPNTRKLTALFMDIVDTIRSKSGKCIVDDIKITLKNVSASDEKFEESLYGSIYLDNPEATRFILCAIEKSYRSRENYTDLWTRNNQNVFVWTIEHIFPEGENIPTCWVEMIANGDRNLAEQYRMQYSHTLGNLTITGYNSALSNMSFERKKDRKSKDNKSIGYNNGLYLNDFVFSKDSWTIDLIKERTKELVEKAVQLFRL